MSAFWFGWLAGFVCAPAVYVVGLLAWDEITPGLTYECWRCGYVSGDLHETPRIVSRVRIRWHRIVTRRLGRCEP